MQWPKLKVKSYRVIDLPYLIVFIFKIEVIENLLNNMAYT